MGWVNNPYITRLKRTQKFQIVGAFAISIRRGEHSHPRHTEPLVAGTVNKAMSDLATSFQDNNQPDPRTTDNNTTDHFISGIIQSFKKVDPKEKSQKAATPQLLLYLYTRISSTFIKIVDDLCCGAFFFACRSCEYSKIQGTYKAKTLTPRNIVFRIGNCVLTNIRIYYIADAVSITFVSQKNDMNHNTVTQHKNASPRFFPVTLWDDIVNGVLDLPGKTVDTTVNAFWNRGTKRVDYITSRQILKSSHWAANSLGKDVLGYTDNEIGCHSIHLGGRNGNVPRPIPNLSTDIHYHAPGTLV